MNLLLQKLLTAKRVHGCTAARPSGETIGCMQDHMHNYNAEQWQTCRKSRDSLSLITGEQTNNYIVSYISYVDECITIATMCTFM